MKELINKLKESGIEIKENENLAEHTTMRAEAYAELFAEVDSPEDLKTVFEALKDAPDTKWMILGGGSNTFFVNDFEGLIIHMNILGIDVLEETDDYALIKVGAGENWHEFVTLAVENNWAGIENLALIPGTVGAAPVQNIGAYGQANEDVFQELEALNIESGEIVKLGKEDMQFGYRDSIFKHEYKDKYIITSVTYKLSKNFEAETSYQSKYESLQGELDGIQQPYKLKDIYNAVISLRNKKLPNINDYGTCGSFFINKVITKDKYKEVKTEIPDLPSFPASDIHYKAEESDSIDSDLVKIPSGMVLDHLGWKGKWIGNVGTFEKHALCVVTNFKASGQEVKDYIEKMKKSVLDAYGIELESEVNIIE